jgi:hypothetical protein
VAVALVPGQVFAAGTTLTNTLTVTFPAAPSLNDCIIIFLSTDTGSGDTGSIPGFTQILDVPAPSFGTRVMVFGKIAGASEPASYTVTFTGSSSNNMWYSGAVYRGTATTTPWSSVTPTTNTGVSPSPTALAITTVSASNLVLAIISAGGSGSPARTSPTAGWANDVPVPSGSGIIDLYSKTQAVAGSPGDFSVSVSNWGFTGIQLALVPSAGSAAPDAPAAPSVSADHLRINAALAVAPADGGAAITDYVWEYAPGPGYSSWTTFADGTSTALTAAITVASAASYKVRVSAVNSVGTSSPSAASAAVAVPNLTGQLALENASFLTLENGFRLMTEVTPTATAPGVPTGLSGTAGSTQVALTWAAPASNGGSAITDYVVEYAVSPFSSWTAFSHTASTATSRTVTGLTNGTGYRFRVKAVNAIGTGSATAATSTYTPAAPVGTTISFPFTQADGPATGWVRASTR